jgi:putative glutamine amidotransferase
MTTLPIIGLTTRRETTTWGHRTEPMAFLQANYVDALGTAGAAPVLLPPPQLNLPIHERGEQVVARLDALIVTGGADIDPHRYGEDPQPGDDPPQPERDSWELALLQAADRIGMPTLGICRGAQAMAVHAGGRLHQHLPDVIGTSHHSPQGPVFADTQVTTTAGSMLNALVGDRLTVGCHHHQAIADHPGFAASAYAADGTVEAIEATASDPEAAKRFCVGVQWHPETREDAGLFAGLIAAARRYRAATSAPATRPALA